MNKLICYEWLGLPLLETECEVPMKEEDKILAANCFNSFYLNEMLAAFKEIKAEKGDRIWLSSVYFRFKAKFEGVDIDTEACGKSNYMLCGILDKLVSCLRAIKKEYLDEESREKVKKVKEEFEQVILITLTF